MDDPDLAAISQHTHLLLSLTTDQSGREIRSQGVQLLRRYDHCLIVEAVATEGSAQLYIIC